MMNKIWKKSLSLTEMNKLCENTAISHLHIEFSQQGADFLCATLPVTPFTQQPMGYLHGGISVALAETVGSMAGFCCVEEGQAVVGSEINANHLRPVQQGIVTAKATPIHLGKTSQVWQIYITDEQDKLCCISRLTLRVVNHE